MRDGVFDGSADRFFIDFCDFAADCDLAISEMFVELVEGF